MAVVGNRIHDVLGVRVFETGLLRQLLEERGFHDVVNQRIADEAARDAVVQIPRNREVGDRSAPPKQGSRWPPA